MIFERKNISNALANATRRLIGLAWFALHSTTLSQFLRMRVMATPYIFLSKQKILTKHL